MQRGMDAAIGSRDDALRELVLATLGTGLLALTTVAVALLTV